jgi:hypothetical protein
VRGAFGASSTAEIVDSIDHAAFFSASTSRTHCWRQFQLAKIWATILRSRELRRSVSFGLGEPCEGCRAGAAQRRRRAAASRTSFDSTVSDGALGGRMSLGDIHENWQGDVSNVVSVAQTFTPA